MQHTTASFEHSVEFASTLDRNDTIGHLRQRFFIPEVNGKPAIYYTGNSLGLQPKTVSNYLAQELTDWRNLGVEGHFKGKSPWFHYHKFFSDSVSKVVGALPSEVVVMNNLTVNLHLLLVSFYRPKGKRYKILMEAGAFPSDMYAIESQVKFHGYDYNDAVIELKPREGEHTLRTEDITTTIAKHAEELALVFFSGVQYYTGQAFDIASITKAAHQIGAKAGFDLAHAAGNILLQLHNWEVDFAAWCSYKYLNSGPGGVSGIFIHEKHIKDKNIPRFAGWWGQKEDTRFLMQRGFDPEPTAAGWQLSNAPILSMAAHRASLDIFDEAGMENLVDKSKLLTAFLDFEIKEACKSNLNLNIQIITPTDRGCQLSLLAGKNGKKLFEYLTQKGVIADWREPEVIRIAPVPLYCTFMEAYNFGELLRKFSI